MYFRYVLPPSEGLYQYPFFKANYEKVKTLFRFEGLKVFFLLSHKMIFDSMFAIEPDSFNSYSCSTLTEVKNPLPCMMSVLNIEFSKYVHLGYVRAKNKLDGASSIIQTNPTKKSGTSNVRTNHRCGVCLNSEKSNLNMFSDYILYSS